MKKTMKETAKRTIPFAKSNNFIRQSLLHCPSLLLLTRHDDARRHHYCDDFSKTQTLLYNCSRFFWVLKEFWSKGEGFWDEIWEEREHSCLPLAATKITSLDFFDRKKSWKCRSGSQNGGTRCLLFLTPLVALIN